MAVEPDVSTASWTSPGSTSSGVINSAEQASLAGGTAKPVIVMPG